MTRVIRKKVGQIWRLNRYSYPLQPGVYTIAELTTDNWGNQIAVVVDATGRRRNINRKGMTTSHNRWNYLGETSDDPKPWVITCRACGAKDVKMSIIPPAQGICTVCGGRTRV